MKFDGKLRAKDIDTCRRALMARERGTLAIYPVGSGQLAHFRRLVQLDLMRFVEHGRDDFGRMVEMFALTPKGAETAETLIRGTKGADR